ncbi:hypothetical protein X739_12365 [Mesorhizobium sp. LNHC220B00]|nr:hypothetical protein X739_12365 [Mesorhizobium sp. LNHC220B00]
MLHPDGDRYRFESDGQQLLIWSDAFLHYVVSIQRPRWHADFDDDKEKAIEARISGCSAWLPNGACSSPATACRFRAWAMSSGQTIAFAGFRSAIS